MKPLRFNVVTLDGELIDSFTEDEVADGWREAFQWAALSSSWHADLGEDGAARARMARRLYQRLTRPEAGA